MDLTSKSHGIARKNLLVNSDGSMADPVLRGVVSQAFRKQRYTSADNGVTDLSDADFANYINFVSGFTVTSLNMPTALQIATVLQGVVGSIQVDDGSSDVFTSVEVNMRNDTSNDITLVSPDINTVFFVSATGTPSVNQVVPSNSTLVFALSFPALGVTPICRFLLKTNTKVSQNLVGNLTPLNDIPGAGPAETLNVYEIATFSTTWSGIWSSPIVADTTFIRLGRMVILHIPDLLATSLLAGSFSNTTTPFPARFRPIATNYGTFRTVIAGVAGSSNFTFTTAGIITVTDSFLIGNSGMRSSFYSYFVAAP